MYCVALHVTEVRAILNTLTNQEFASLTIICTLMTPGEKMNVLYLPRKVGMEVSKGI